MVICAGNTLFFVFCLCSRFLLYGNHEVYIEHVRDKNCPSLLFGSKFKVIFLKSKSLYGKFDSIDFLKELLPFNSSAMNNKTLTNFLESKGQVGRQPEAMRTN